MSRPQETTAHHLRANYQAGLAVVVILSLLCHADRMLAEDKNELVYAVLDAMRANDERMGAVALVITTTTSYSHQENGGYQAIREFPTAGGGKVTIIAPEPLSSEASHLLINERFFEARVLSKEGDLERAWQQLHDEWREFRPKARQLVIRREDQLPRVAPMHPSRLFTASLGQTLEDIVTVERTVVAERFDDANFGPGSIRIEVKTATGNQPLVLTFGSNSEFLPVRSVLMTSANRDVVWEKTLTYQSIPERSAMLLSTARTKYIAPRNVERASYFFQGETSVTVDSYELLTSADVDVRQLMPAADWNVQDMTRPLAAKQ